MGTRLQPDSELEAIAKSLVHIGRRSPEDRTRVRVGNIEFGGDRFIVIAGPCAVESERQLMETAEAVKRAGAAVLRGGAFKPRTSPYAFQGLGLEGLKLLRKASEAFDIPVVSEAITDSQVDLVAEYVDMLQIGARSMANVALLDAASRCGRPVLLKRGMTATVQELLRAADGLAATSPGVVLCERGIRTFETLTRNTCDLAAVALLNHLTSLPVVVDPSHATGRRSLIPAVSRAAVAVGADGLMVEVHPAPETALSDGEQSLSIAEFEALEAQLAPFVQLRPLV